MSDLLERLKPTDPDHIITVQGIGGVGKTALVLEAARRCLNASRKNLTDAPQFDAIIFTSAKQEWLSFEGISPTIGAERNLQAICRVMSQKLKAPIITQAITLDELVEQVHQITNDEYETLRKRILLIVDNLDTIEDQSLVMIFLRRKLPMAVKVVLTSRDLMDAAPISLPNLTLDEGLRLIQQKADEQEISISEEEAKQLYERMGGIPLAIVYAVGQLASGDSLEEVLEELVSKDGELAQYIFKASVKRLRESSSYKLLMSLAIFPDPCTREAVAEVAGLSQNRSEVKTGLRELIKRSLILDKEKQKDQSLGSQKERYSMHPLTREYALQELGDSPDFELEARERWVKWYLDFSQKFGGHDKGAWYENYGKLEKEWINLQAVLDWCATKNSYPDVRDLWKQLNDYVDIYRLWHDRFYWLNWLIEKSKQHDDWSTFVYAMSRKGWALTAKNRLTEAQDCLRQAGDQRKNANIQVQADFAYFIARFYMHQRENTRALEKALLWLKKVKKLTEKPDWEDQERTRYLINIFYFQGKIECYQQKYEEAEKRIENAINMARGVDWLRCIVRAKNWLAYIAIQKNQFTKAESLLKEGLETATSNEDKRSIAYYQENFAWLEERRFDQGQGNSETLNKCRQWANQARENFHLLGIAREEKRMQNLLNQLSFLT